MAERRSSDGGRNDRGGGRRPRSGQARSERSRSEGRSDSGGGRSSAKGSAAPSGSRRGSGPRRDGRTGQGDGRRRDGSSGGKRRQRDHEGGRREQKNGGQPPRRAFSAGGGPSNIPKWLREEIARVTPKDRREALLALFSEAASDYADERFGRAHEKLVRAKKMSSRAAAVRELLGLTAYRMQRWEEALRELRAFRRMAGDTTHMPVEMDTLRALGRGEDVRKVWTLFQELGGRPLIDAEARVVYGSFLLDEGDPRAAWEVTKPGRVSKDARVGDLRRWYVAARAAAALGDIDTARQLSRAIVDADENQEIDGLDELDAEIVRAESRKRA